MGLQLGEDKMLKRIALIFCITVILSVVGAIVPDLPWSAEAQQSWYASRIVPQPALPATCQPGNGMVVFVTAGANQGFHTCSAVANVWRPIAVGTLANGNIVTGPASAITTGTGNTIYGQAAGDAITTGLDNTAIGDTALSAVTTVGDNTAVGADALALTTATNNTAVGRQAGVATTTGAGNTFIGRNAGATNTTGGSNVFYGSSAGGINTTGNSNVAIGTSAGSTAAANLSNSIYIGTNAGNPAAASDQLWIDNSNTATPLIFGNFATDTVAINSRLTLAGVLFAALGAPVNGQLVYCSDCTIGAVCAGAGTGAIAKGLAGAWVCN